MNPLDKHSFFEALEYSETIDGYSDSTIKRFWEWMYSDVDGAIQVCAFGIPTTNDSGEEVEPQGKWEHVNSYNQFLEFCKTYSGLWTYHVYSGVNSLDTRPTNGRGSLDHIDKVNHITFDIETKREPNSGSTYEEVWWSYQYALAQAKYMLDQFEVLPLVVMSENGIHMHYKANVPVDKSLMYNKQHIISKYLTHKASTSSYAKSIKNRSPDHIEFDQDDVSDPARVMKVAGTLGQKSKHGRMCGIVHEPSDEYSNYIEVRDIDLKSAMIYIDELEEESTDNISYDSKEIDQDDVKRRLKNVLHVDAKLRSLYSDGDILNYKSRSEAEMATAVKFLSHGFSPSEVETMMYNSELNKWNEESQHYRERTIEQAIKHFDGVVIKDSKSSSLEFSVVSK